MSIDLVSLLQSLSKQRPLFHSEADFQHTLAWELHYRHPEWQVRLEMPFSLDESSVHLDIWVRNGLDELAIELKYKTAILKVHRDGEHYALKSQAAQDLARYDYIKDIVRLERITAQHPQCVGWAIFLTNVAQYWQSTRNTHSVDRAFRLHDECELTGTLAWDTRVSAGTIRRREPPLVLQGEYLLNWRDYSRIDAPANGTFRYLAVQV